MESYRNSFRAQSGLDITARGRLGRHAAALGPRDSIHLITNEQAYKDVRPPSWVG